MFVLQSLIHFSWELEFEKGFYEAYVLSTFDTKTQF